MSVFGQSVRRAIIIALALVYAPVAAFAGSTDQCALDTEGKQIFDCLSRVENDFAIDPNLPRDMDPKTLACIAHNHSASPKEIISAMAIATQHYYLKIERAKNDIKARLALGMHLTQFDHTLIGSMDRVRREAGVNRSILDDLRKEAQVQRSVYKKLFLHFNVVMTDDGADFSRFNFYAVSQPDPKNPKNESEEAALVRSLFGDQIVQAIKDIYPRPSTRPGDRSMVFLNHAVVLGNTYIIPNRGFDQKAMPQPMVAKAYADAYNSAYDVFRERAQTYLQKAREYKDWTAQGKRLWHSARQTVLSWVPDWVPVIGGIPQDQDHYTQAQMVEAGNSMSVQVNFIHWQFGIDMHELYDNVRSIEGKVSNEIKEATDRLVLIQKATYILLAATAIVATGGFAAGILGPIAAAGGSWAVVASIGVGAVGLSTLLTGVIVAHGMTAILSVFKAGLQTKLDPEGPTFWCNLMDTFIEDQLQTASNEHWNLLTAAIFGGFGKALQIIGTAKKLGVTGAEAAQALEGLGQGAKASPATRELLARIGSERALIASQAASKAATKTLLIAGLLLPVAQIPKYVEEWKQSSELYEEAITLDARGQHAEARARRAKAYKIRYGIWGEVGTAILFPLFLHRMAERFGGPKITPELEKPPADPPLIPQSPPAEPPPGANNGEPGQGGSHANEPNGGKPAGGDQPAGPPTPEGSGTPPTAKDIANTEQQIKALQDQADGARKGAAKGDPKSLDLYEQANKDLQLKQARLIRELQARAAELRAMGAKGAKALRKIELQIEDAKLYEDAYRLKAQNAESLRSGRSRYLDYDESRAPEDRARFASDPNQVPNAHDTTEVIAWMDATQARENTFFGHLGKQMEAGPGSISDQILALFEDTNLVTSARAVIRNALVRMFYLSNGKKPPLGLVEKRNFLVSENETVERESSVDWLQDQMGERIPGLEKIPGARAVGPRGFRIVLSEVRELALHWVGDYLAGIVPELKLMRLRGRTPELIRIGREKGFQEYFDAYADQEGFRKTAFYDRFIVLARDAIELWVVGHYAIDIANVIRGYHEAEKPKDYVDPSQFEIAADVPGATNDCSVPSSAGIPHIDGKGVHLSELLDRYIWIYKEANSEGQSKVDRTLCEEYLVNKVSSLKGDDWVTALHAIDRKTEAMPQAISDLAWALELQWESAQNGFNVSLQETHKNKNISDTATFGVFATSLFAHLPNRGGLRGTQLYFAQFQRMIGAGLRVSHGYWLYVNRYGKEVKVPVAPAAIIGVGMPVHGNALNEVDFLENQNAIYKELVITPFELLAISGSAQMIEFLESRIGGAVFKNKLVQIGAQIATAYVTRQVLNDVVDELQQAKRLAHWDELRDKLQKATAAFSAAVVEVKKDKNPKTQQQLIVAMKGVYATALSLEAAQLYPYLKYFQAAQELEISIDKQGNGDSKAHEEAVAELDSQTYHLLKSMESDWGLISNPEVAAHDAAYHVAKDPNGPATAIALMTPEIKRQSDRLFGYTPEADVAQKKAEAYLAQERQTLRARVESGQISRRPDLMLVEINGFLKSYGGKDPDSIINRYTDRIIEVRIERYAEYFDALSGHQ